MHPLEEQSSSCCGNLSAQTAPRAAFLLRIALAALSAGAEAILRASARPRSRSDLRRPRRALGPPQGRHSAAQRDPPGSQRLTFSRQAAPGAGTAVRWMTISCPPLCTSLSCSSTAMLRAVLTDTRWSSDQASGSNPLTPCCSRTAGSLLTAVSRNPALAAAAAASSTSESSPSGGSSSPAAGTDGLPPLSAAAILPPPHGRLARTARAPPPPPKAPRRAVGLSRRCLSAAASARWRRTGRCSSTSARLPGG